MKNNQNNQLMIILILLIGVTIIVYRFKNKTIDNKIVEKTNIWQNYREDIVNSPSDNNDISETPPKLNLEPIFENWPKVQDISDNSLGAILSDIESHIKAGHPYRDNNKMTWAHETTHGINSNIRNNHPDAAKINGFYCLNDRAVRIYEPPTKINTIAKEIPEAFRGPSYNLYLNKSMGWNDRPLYLFDEWTAYTNGSATGRELNVDGWYFELLQAHNFNIYCIYLAMVVKRDCPEYDDTQMKAFMMWNTERTFELAKPYNSDLKVLTSEGDIYKVPFFHSHEMNSDFTYGDNPNSEPTKAALNYIEIVKSDPSGEEMRRFAREYFGKDWCLRTYGF